MLGTLWGEYDEREGVLTPSRDKRLGGLRESVTMVTLNSKAMKWLLLSYHLPREPSRPRLAVWRRLRRMGAVLLHESIWTLPVNPKTREAIEWLAEEIEEDGGTALLWEAECLAPKEERLIVARFRSEAQARYRAIADSAAAIRRAATSRRRTRSAALVVTAMRQLRGLERAVRLERRRDYFRVEARAEAESAVDAAVTAVTAVARVAPFTPSGHSDAVDHATALSR